MLVGVPALAGDGRGEVCALANGLSNAPALGGRLAKPRRWADLPSFLCSRWFSGANTEAAASALATRPFLLAYELAHPAVLQVGVNPKILRGRLANGFPLELFPVAPSFHLTPPVRASYLSKVSVESGEAQPSRAIFQK